MLSAGHDLQFGVLSSESIPPNQKRRKVEGGSHALPSTRVFGSKVRGAILAPEIELSLFIENLSFGKEVHDPTQISMIPQGPISSWGRETPACEWSAVICRNGTVTELRWNGLRLGGSPSWGHLPLGLEVLQLGADNTHFSQHTNQLEGPVIIESLPSTLRSIDLSSNLLSGIFSLSGLPRRIEFLDISNNCFEGKLELQSLPFMIQVCDLSKNHFEGEIKLDNLTPSLHWLSLENNSLSGFLNISSLSPYLKILLLSDNYFNGTLSFVDLPASVQFLDLRRTDVSMCGNETVPRCVRIGWRATR